MKRWLMLWIGVALLISFLIQAAPIQADAYTPPHAVQLRWLDPGQLLVQWEQVSQADKVTVMWCREWDQNVCKPYLEVFNRQPGPRYAVLPAEPGMFVRFAEWEAAEGTFKLLSWEPGTAAPQYGTLLPAVVR